MDMSCLRGNARGWVHAYESSPGSSRDEAGAEDLHPARASHQEGPARMTAHRCSGGCGRYVIAPEKWCASSDCWPSPQEAVADWPSPQEAVADAIRTVERRLFRRREERPHTGRRAGEIRHPSTDSADQIVDASMSYGEATKDNQTLLNRIAKLERLLFIGSVELRELLTQQEQEQDKT